MSKKSKTNSKNKELTFAQKLERTKYSVNTLFKHWVAMMGLGWWEDVTIHTYNTANDMPEGQKDADAFASVQWEYKTATVGFCLERLVDRTPEQIERVIVHELCHLLVNAMREYKAMGQPIEELVVTNLSQSILWCVEEYRGKVSEGKWFDRSAGGYMSTQDYDAQIKKLTKKCRP